MNAVRPTLTVSSDEKTVSTVQTGLDKQLHLVMALFPPARSQLGLIVHVGIRYVIHITPYRKI